MTNIGKSIPLSEGPAKVQGSVKYCGDLMCPGMLHARLVTSPYAHARLDSVDTAAALTVPGVVAVLTAADMPEIPPTSRSTLLLARDRVLFVGHPIALVLAESEAAAQDGAEQVAYDAEPLPASIDLDAAMREDAAAVWPEGLPGQSAEAAAHGADSAAGSAGAKAGSPNIANRVEFPRGDLVAGFAAADVVLERTFDTAAVHQGYIEPHAVMVDIDPTGLEAQIWTNTQATFYVRDTVAGVLGMPNTAVRVIGTPVGGGFGGKFLLYEPMMALAARIVGRPVRHIMSRYEEMVTANPAPATRVEVKLGATRDGKFTALEANMYMDNGCFPNSMGGLAGVLLGSPYQVPNQVIRGIEVLTNKSSVGAYRAPCAPQCCFALESVVDEMAAELGMDAVELRRRNASSPGDPMAMGNPWPSMGMKEVLEAANDHPVWKNREQARALGRGVGLAIGGWPGGTEPASAACQLQTDGTLQVNISSVDLTGTNTTIAQLAAEAYGVEADQVRIVTGDTATGPFAGSSGGSKILYTVGPAVIQAAEEARQQTFELAAQKFEAAVEDLEIRDGKVQVKGSPDQAIPLAKLAQSTMRYGARQAPVLGHGRHAQLSGAPGFCAQIAEVEVDRETGHVTLHKLVVIQDVGNSINPMMVEGQMAGGAIQGVGWALYEQMVWGNDGQIQTGSFTDYALPHMPHAPLQLDLVRVEVPSPTGPYGARGVGEPPVVPTAGAIANAIHDAIQKRPTELPMSAPRLARLLNAS
jgi:CO/xanthine dehydrogenase Mo-binding subunit